MTRFGSISLVVVLALGCGSKTEKPWWDTEDACPAGSTVEREAESVFCITADGLRHGRFETLTTDGVVQTSGSYHAGKRDGVWTQRSSSGAVLGTFKLNKGNGRVTTWREDGTIASQADVVGDARHGSFVAFHADGRARAEVGTFEDGKRSGTWTFRDASGPITREVDYRDGEVWETRHFEGGLIARTELSEAAAAAKASRYQVPTMPYDDAKHAGILGVLSQQQGGAFASLTGTGSFSAGLDDANVYGGLLGTEVGEMKGGFGYGVKGTGPGGGGTGWGTIGTGRYGQIGHGSGSTGYGTGSGRGRAAPRVRIGASTVTGSLDKNIIRRYIRRKLRQVRYCYEKRLLKKPELAGRIVVSFVINASGRVQATRATGLGDSTVESCVRKVIASIMFPKPKGGGVVKVSYPFILRPGSAAATPTKTPQKPSARPTPEAPPTATGGAMKPRNKR